MNAERWEEALKSLSEVIDRDDRNARAHFWSAICHAKLGEEIYLASPNSNQQAVLQEVFLAKYEVGCAEEYLSSDPELQDAITEFKKQLSL
jgi:hypothetical protein